MQADKPNTWDKWYILYMNNKQIYVWSQLFMYNKSVLYQCTVRFIIPYRYSVYMCTEQRVMKRTVSRLLHKQISQSIHQTLSIRRVSIWERRGLSLHVVVHRQRDLNLNLLVLPLTAQSLAPDGDHPLPLVRLLGLAPPPDPRRLGWDWDHAGVAACTRSGIYKQKLQRFCKKNRI